MDHQKKIPLRASVPFCCTQLKNLAKGDFNCPNYKTFPDQVIHRGGTRGWDKAGFYPPSGLCKSSNQRWPVQKADITPNMQPSSSQVSHAFQMDWAWSHFPHKLWVYRERVGRLSWEKQRLWPLLILRHFLRFYKPFSSRTLMNLKRFVVSPPAIQHFTHLRNDSWERNNKLWPSHKWPQRRLTITVTSKDRD